MKKYILSIAFIVATFYSFGQDVDKLIKQDEVERIIKTLAADDMQGRATFTPGIEKAAQFIEGEFKKISLNPLPGNADYRQQVTMVKSTPGSATVSINGINADNFFIASGGSFSWANPTDVEVVNFGPDMDFNKNYRDYLTSGKKYLVLVDPSFAGIFRVIKNRYNAGTTTFKDAVRKSPVVFVVGKFDKVTNFIVNHEAKVQEIPLFNVAGVIPGKTKPDEFVIFSAHYDHLGLTRSIQGDSIYNGADDDASGVTAVIALANYFKKANNNARTLIFVAFAAEEIGGYGATYFSKQVNPDKVVAMFNIEMIGKPSKFGANSAFITGYEKSDFGAILQKNLSGTKFTFHPDPYTKENLFYRSDNATLARLGVPAHTISTVQIDTDKFYHQVTDEVSTLDMNNITSTIKAIALSSRSIVAGEAAPSRVAKESVR